jgi:hypothetical protein
MIEVVYLIGFLLLKTGETQVVAQRMELPEDCKNDILLRSYAPTPPNVVDQKYWCIKSQFDPLRNSKPI